MRNRRAAAAQSSLHPRMGACCPPCSARSWTADRTPPASPSTTPRAWSPEGTPTLSRARQGPKRWTAAHAAVAAPRLPGTGWSRRPPPWSSAAVDADCLVKAVRETLPGSTIIGRGEHVAVMKSVGHPHGLAAEHGLEAHAGSAGPGPHPDGHRIRRHRRRFATPSPSAETCAWSTTARSPTTPPSAATCVREGVVFDSDNDTEVGARYVASQLAAGRRPGDGADEPAATVFDGFYTLVVTTADSLAVVRDPIACKPAIIAETADYVAMASEYRALASCPASRPPASSNRNPERSTHGHSDRSPPHDSRPSTDADRARWTSPTPRSAT